MPKPHKDITRKLQTISTMNKETKILNKMIAKGINSNKWIMTKWALSHEGRVGLTCKKSMQFTMLINFWKIYDQFNGCKKKILTMCLENSIFILNRNSAYQQYEENFLNLIMVSMKNLQRVFYFIIKDQMTIVITFIQHYRQGLASAIR